MVWQDQTGRINVDHAKQSGGEFVFPDGAVDDWNAVVVSINVSAMGYHRRDNRNERMQPGLLPLSAYWDTEARFGLNPVQMYVLKAPHPQRLEFFYQWRTTRWPARESLYWTAFADHTVHCAQLQMSGTGRTGSLVQPPIEIEWIANEIWRRVLDDPRALTELSTNRRLIGPTKVIRPTIAWWVLRLPLGVVSIAAAIVVIRRIRLSVALRTGCAPWCPRCRYPLTPAMPHCPECGTPIRWPETA